MRRLMKQIAAVCLAAACLISLSACSQKQEASEETVYRISTEGTPADDMMAEEVKIYAYATLGLSDEELIVNKMVAESQGNEKAAQMYEDQLTVREEMGDMKEIESESASVVLLEDGSYTVTVPIHFTKGTKQYVFNFNGQLMEIDGEFTDLSAGEEDSSISALMNSATVYSGIGIGTVFAVLIFISLLIYCFKFIHAWETGSAAKKSAPPAPVTPVAVPKAAPPAPAPDLSEDTELVAVVTAAIAAYEGTSSNGLVVRSIRRVQGSKRR